MQASLQIPASRHGRHHPEASLVHRDQLSQASCSCMNESAVEEAQTARAQISCGHKIWPGRGIAGLLQVHNEGLDPIRKTGRSPLDGSRVIPQVQALQDLSDAIFVHTNRSNNVLRLG
jgi:hypothetical protein